MEFTEAQLKVYLQVGLKTKLMLHSLVLSAGTDCCYLRERAKLIKYWCCLSGILPKTCPQVWTRSWPWPPCSDWITTIRGSLSVFFFFTSKFLSYHFILPSKMCCSHCLGHWLMTKGWCAGTSLAPFPSPTVSSSGCFVAMPPVRVRPCQLEEPVKKMQILGTYLSLAWE